MSARLASVHRLKQQLRVRLALGLLMGLMACVQQPPGPQLTLAAAGNPPTRRSLKQLTALVASSGVTIRDPHEQRLLEYEALPLAPLLEAIPGAHKPGNDLVFRCADGYEATVTQDTWQSYGEHAYLAYRIRGRSRFEVHDAAGDKQITLGPYYLIWDSRRQPALRVLSSSHWPYQVTSIESAALAQRIAAITPPGGTPPGVKRGLELFRRHCFACHSINGRGGALGPELNFPVSVTEYFDGAWLARWIRDPRQLRLKPKMPSLAALGIPAEQRARATADLIAYLQAMAQHKLKPR